MILLLGEAMITTDFVKRDDTTVSDALQFPYIEWKLCSQHIQRVAVNL